MILNNDIIVRQVGPDTENSKYFTWQIISMIQYFKYIVFLDGYGEMGATCLVRPNQYPPTLLLLLINEQFKIVRIHTVREPSLFME